MKKVRIFGVALILFCLVYNGFGQTRENEKEKFSDKLFYGGSIGLVVGQVTQIDILPMIGMWVFPQWSVGVTGRYSFYSQRYRTIGSNASFKTNIWGASGFTQILPVPDFHKTFGVDIHGGLLLHGEYEALYVDRSLANPTNSVNGKQWIKMVLVGGGYRQKLGDKSALYILVLWDLTKNEYSPYSTNPLLRVSITF